MPANGAPSDRMLDGLGLVLVAALGGWVAFAAGGGGGRPGPMLWLLAGLVGAVFAGRVLAVRPGLVSRMVSAAVTGAAVLTWPGILDAGGAPTGYANANATLTALGAIAAVDAGRTCRFAPERRAWLFLSAVLVVLTVSTGSAAGILSLGLGLVVLGLSALVRWPGIAVVGGMIAVSVALSVTSVIALGSDPAGLGERAGVRSDLWAEAADLIDEEPVRGIGPGAFAERSSVSTDADLRWAHHGYLQVGAELGAVGLALVLALAGYVWARLWRVGAHAPSTAAVGGAGLAIIGIHGTVDYVWHAPAVLLIAAFWIGPALASSKT